MPFIIVTSLESSMDSRGGNGNLIYKSVKVTHGSTAVYIAEYFKHNPTSVKRTSLSFIVLPMQSLNFIPSGK